MVCSLTMVRPQSRLVLHEFLTTTERRRVAELRHRNDQDRFTIGRCAVRSLAARKLDCNPSDVSLALDRRGRPWLPGSGLECSISHSGDMVAVGVAKRRIGVDIQNRPETIPHGWTRILLAEETERVGLDETGHFLHRWSQVEAIVKFTGLGLGTSPKTTRILLRQEGLTSHYRTPLGPATCATLELSADHALSACSGGVFVWRVQPEPDDLVANHLRSLRSWLGSPIAEASDQCRPSSQ